MPQGNQIRVLVVDDSSFLRRNLPLLLESDPEIKVIGTAEDGSRAIEMARELHPDVITLDVIMPVMDGLSALRVIMKEIPTPVVMVSSVTYEGARQAVESLSLGAVDCVVKPSGAISLDIAKIKKELVEKVKTAHAARAKIRAGHGSAAAEKFRKIQTDLSAGPSGIHPVPAPNRGKRRNSEIIAIAASTGGPAALQVLLAGLPGNLPAGVVLVQHISEGFAAPLAERLNGISPLEVRICSDYEPVLPGRVLVAPAGRHMAVKRVDGRLFCTLRSEPGGLVHVPSADVLFESVARVCGHRACAVILTGMGNDGAGGIKEIRNKGGVTIAQDEATSIIFGMPRAAIAQGAIDFVVPLEEIADRILEAV